MLLDYVQQLPRGERPLSAQAFLEHAVDIPDWVDWARVERGQQFYLTHAVGLGSCLLHLSLIGGFAAPRINKVRPW